MEEGERVTGKGREAEVGTSTLADHVLAGKGRRLLALAISSLEAFLASSLIWVLLLWACLSCLALLVLDKEFPLRRTQPAPHGGSCPASRVVVLQHPHPDQQHCSGSLETCRRRILPRMLTTPWESSQAVALHLLQGHVRHLQAADQTASSFP